MGISGLLPIIKPVLQKKHISLYSGKTVGIDGHAWLYQVAPSISEELFFGIPTKKHIHILSSKIRPLRRSGIRVIFVFDGDTLKSKNKTFLERLKRKEEARVETLRLLKANNMSKAREMMKRCVQITDDLMASVIEYLKKESIEFIISPYESDAQLAYLQRINYIDCVLTEDSDLIIYGATNILYKYDLSYVYEYRKEDLAKAWNGFFASNILEICILSGCDYLSGLPGVGVKTACKLLEKHMSVECAITSWKLKAEVPENFLGEFERARMTFLYQVVFDPLLKKRVFLGGDPQKGLELGFLGSFIESEEKFSSGEHFRKKGVCQFFAKKAKDECKDRERVLALEDHDLSGVPEKKEKEIVVDERTISPYFQR